jgi:shikimate dehydrogenase
MTEFRAAGVIGWPVAHSRSPMIHGHWLRRHGIDGAYITLPVHPDQMQAALRGLAALGFAGCNVTVPHKEAALALVDRADATARRIGAVNLIVVRPDGTLDGSNTDAFGFLANLRERVTGWQAADGPAVVLGAGGSARAVLAALCDSGCPEVRLVNRTRERAEALAAQFGGAVQLVDWDRRAAALDGAALLVNTTTQGMAGQPALDLGLSALPRAAVVTDLVYVPLETPLLAAARARGNRVADGLGMLLHQARPSFAAWFGVLPEVTAELRREIEATL